MPWKEYRPFVLKLFGVREETHTRYGMQLDLEANVFTIPNIDAVTARLRTELAR